MSNETKAKLAEQIDYAIQGCADEGIGLTASGAAELLASIDDPEVAAQQVEELARLLRLSGAAAEEGSGLTIAYIPDLVFHQRVDEAVKGIMDAAPASDRLGVDQAITEGLLADGIWPQSWEALMPDHDKQSLVVRIVQERGGRA